MGLPGGSVDASVLEVLEWRPIGPWRGGKSIAGAGHPTEPGVFYMGSTNGGGVWKTDDAGVSWHNLSDGYFGTTTVSSLAISESDPEILYVGTGDVSFRTNISRGDGLYRSSDGGRSWENMGLADTRNLSRDRGASARPGSRLRRLARTRVHSGRESRPVSLPRRRRDVGARPLHRRRDRGHRPHHGPERTRHAVHGDVERAPFPLDDPRRGSWQRDLEIDGWWRHLGRHLGGPRDSPPASRAGFHSTCPSRGPAVCGR